MAQQAKRAFLLVRVNYHLVQLVSSSKLRTEHAQYPSDASSSLRNQPTSELADEASTARSTIAKRQAPSSGPDQEGKTALSCGELPATVLAVQLHFWRDIQVPAAGRRDHRGGLSRSPLPRGGSCFGSCSHGAAPFTPPAHAWAKFMQIYASSNEYFILPPALGTCLELHPLERKPRSECLRET